MTVILLIYIADTCYARNTDFNGYDLYDQEVANFETCETKCQQDTNCYFYTYGVKEKRCWSKKGDYYFKSAMENADWGNKGSYISGWQSCK